MTKPTTDPTIDDYLRERLMPVEGAIPHIPGIEMFGNSIPAETLADNARFKLCVCYGLFCGTAILTVRS